MSGPHPAHKVKLALSVGHHKVVVEAVVVSSGAGGEDVSQPGGHHMSQSFSVHLVGVLRSKTVPATLAREPVGISLSDTGVKLEGVSSGGHGVHCTVSTCWQPSS